MHLGPEDGEWLHSPALRQAVEGAFFRTADPAVAEALSLIGEYLAPSRR